MLPWLDDVDEQFEKSTSDMVKFTEDWLMYAAPLVLVV